MTVTESLHSARKAETERLLLSQSPFSSDYQTYMYLSKYSRWIEAKGRRETWNETVDRYFDFFDEYLLENHNYVVPGELRAELWEAVYNQQVMPSMRALATAGPALKRDPVAGYNCAFLPIDSLRSFDEAFYIMMCGTGVGFSVEQRHINQLPIISEHFEKSNTTIVVDDSKGGWSRALKELLNLLSSGQIPKWDLSNVRPAGMPLKTMGGRASGPGPLAELFDFSVRMFQDAAGRRLHSIEAHDLMCKIGDTVVVGGVRRTAQISLSDLSDEKMRNAKSGAWFEQTPYRSLANNSAVYNEKPDPGTFLEEWTSLYRSKSGERGIFNREGSKHHVATRGRDPNWDFGTNPCGEIILRPCGLCNLSEIIIRENNHKESLIRKARLASILGTWQSCLTSFKYLRKVWRKNCEEERLLGVSMTGIFDNPLTSARNNNASDFRELTDLLGAMRSEVWATNAKTAEDIGINESAALTCNKPSGNGSQFFNSASGVHPRHSKYYIRTVREDNKSPICQFMKHVGIPNEPDLSKPYQTTIFSFPVAAPKQAVTRHDISAIEHLELWLVYKNVWCDHNPSVTISVKEDEWLRVGAWVYDHFDSIGGLSFLPYFDANYKQMPFQEISEDEYHTTVENFPKKIDWSGLTTFETEDTTTSAKEYACVGGACEVNL